MNIFDFSLSLILFFSGITKLVYFRNTMDTMKRIEVFPDKYVNYIAIILPIFELTQAILLIIKSNIVTQVLIIGYLLFFILLNLKTYLGGEKKECCCYGKFLKSKLGLGGLFHYLYWLIIIVCSIIINSIQIFQYQVEKNFCFYIIGICIVINGLVIRMLIESAQ